MTRPLDSRSPTIIKLLYCEKFNVYIAMYDIGVRRQRESSDDYDGTDKKGIHPDSCVVKILHANLCPLASFLPHGKDRGSRVVDMVWNESLCQLVTSGQDKKIKVWELYDDDDDNEEDEDDEMAEYFRSEGEKKDSFWLI